METNTKIALEILKKLENDFDKSENESHGIAFSDAGIFLAATHNETIGKVSVISTVVGDDKVAGITIANSMRTDKRFCNIMLNAVYMYMDAHENPDSPIAQHFEKLRQNAEKNKEFIDKL